MSSAAFRLSRLLLVFLACLHAEAQTAEKAASQPPEPQSASQSTDVEQVPRVPGVSTLLRGFNAGLSFSQAHDSAAGWYNVATPAIGYTFSPHYSADASVSIYPYRLVENQNPATVQNQRLVTSLGDVSDTIIGLHAALNPRLLRTITTASLAIPTGNRSDGLGTGRFTFDFSDRIERYFGKTGLLADLGAGDSSGLFNRLVTQQQSSLGALAHFQVGAEVYLPWDVRVQSVAYEQLPIGNQKVYTTVSAPDKPSQTVLTGNGVSEDNGFTTSLAIQLTDHLTVWGYYNRSLRLHQDTASTGISYVLRGTPRRRTLSLIDKALREAEGANR